MKSYSFNSPVKLVLGLGARREVGAEAAKFGKRAAIVVDASLVTVAGEVKKTFEEKGLETFLYDKVKGEPTIESMEDASAFAKQSSADLVVGIGGGSTLDTAKVAAARITNERAVADMIGADKVQNRAVPLILLPTTAGTGSEVNKIAIILANERKALIVSDNIAARTAFVDPELTVTSPPSLTAQTGGDTLAHAVEGLMSLDSNPLVNSLALEAARLVENNLRRAYYNGRDIEARFNMSFASTMAGLVLCGTLAVYGHSVSYTLTRYKIPHGLGTAFALPYAMEVNVPIIPEKLAQLGDALGVSQDSIKNRAREAISKVRELLRDVGIPESLEELKVPKEDLRMLARELVEKYPRTNNPRQLRPEEAMTLYENMWNGQPLYQEIRK